MTGSRKKKLFDDDETPAYVYVLIVIAFGSCHRVYYSVW